MALPPIQGASSFFAGANSTYTNTTAGGTWSTGNSAIVTINASTGVATGVAQGATQIIYTVGSDSTALNITVNATGKISNGFDALLVLGALQNEVLWTSQGTSTSGRYFQDFHPLCDETILRNLPNIGGDYDTFLSSLNKSVILECVNAVFDKPQIQDSTRLVFNRSDNMLVTQPVNNIGQFVGLKLQISPGDYGIKISNLMLFFDREVTFPMYLYNDMDLPPLYQLEVTTSPYQQVIIPLQNNVILNYLTPTVNKGGIWYFGYYQDDLGDAKAIYYPIAYSRFSAVNCYSFSAPTYTDPLGQQNFRRNVIGANNLTYGMNLEMATMIDATNSIVENPSMWNELVGLRMACKIIELCKFSYQTNSIQRAIQGLGGLDELNYQLNGRPANSMIGQPKITGLIERTQRAVNTVKQGFQPVYAGGVGLL